MRKHPMGATRRRPALRAPGRPTEGCRPYELVDGVGLGEFVSGHELRHQGVEGGEAKAAAVPITAPTKHSSYRWASPSANQSQAGDGQGPGDVGPEQQCPAREPVRDGPANEQEGHLRRRRGQADVGQGRRPVARWCTPARR